jgi:hypothetical protein
MAKALIVSNEKQELRFKFIGKRPFHCLGTPSFEIMSFKYIFENCKTCYQECRVYAVNLFYILPISTENNDILC